MNKYTKTSVIIPVYNEPEYLKQSLSALLNQTLPVHEIIVVDNNSTDNSIQAAKEQFQNVKYVEEKQQGIVWARNKGFNVATGDLLVKLDADTAVFPNWHENLVNDMNRKDLDAWSGYVTVEEVNPRFIKLCEFLFNTLTFVGMRTVSGVVPLFGSNMAISKQSWDKIKGKVTMRNDIWEDLDVAINLSNITKRVYVSRRVTAKISSRSANAPLKVLYKRLYGQSRVYLIHQKYLSYALSLVLMHISFTSGLLIMPFVKFGQVLSTRPRPEQY